MQGLKIVRREAGNYALTELLVGPKDNTIRITVEERDIPAPLISLLLHEYYEFGAVIDAGEPYGMQMSVTLPYILHGHRHYISGAAVPLLNGPLLAIPIGFFRRLH